MRVNDKDEAEVLRLALDKVNSELRKRGRVSHFDLATIGILKHPRQKIRIRVRLSLKE